MLNTTIVPMEVSGDQSYTFDMELAGYITEVQMSVSEDNSLVSMEVIGEDPYAFTMDISDDITEVQMESCLRISSATAYYTGSYDFIPTESAQTISISGLTASANIIVEPIPSNYGRITYNGATLTVS